MAPAMYHDGLYPAADGGQLLQPGLPETES
jgi:hypothetical protein